MGRHQDASSTLGFNGETLIRTPRRTAAVLHGGGMVM